MAEDILALHDICRCYGDRTVVNNAAFSLRQGEFTALLGPNGAGKSSLMDILSGSMEQDEGLVFFKGEDRNLNRKQYQQSLGYLPERLPLSPDRTVREQLIYAGRLKDLSQKEAVQQAEEMCGILKLEEVFFRRIGHLSKGFRQRSALAQAFIGEPSLLLLDEPFSGLDPSQIKDVRDYLFSLKNKTTLLISTHVLEHASSLCSRFLFIKDGTILADGGLDVLAESQENNKSSLEEIFLNFMDGSNDNGA